MTRGLIRYQESGQTHFVTFSCYRRLRHLGEPSARDLFVRCLEQTRKRYGVRVFGYVVMPEHVHLLISEPDSEPLQKAMQSLKLAVAKRSRVAPFWYARYYDRNVPNHEEFVEKLRYIHRNPVKRGLCARPEDWPWSSFCHYATGVEGKVEIESEWTARKRELKD